MEDKRTLLVTPSLLDSLDWLLECPASWRDRAYKSLLATIRREPYKAMPQAERGIAFEKAVYAGKTGSPVFNEIVEYCKGGQYQKVIKTKMAVDSRTIVLYGKLDVDFKDKIVDIKTIENAAKMSKYLDKWQHIHYLYVTDKPLFEYLVVLFDAHPSNKVLGYKILPYNNPGRGLLQEKLEKGIVDLFEWLKEEKLFYDYETTYSNNKR